ncbi:hypothetical protein K437DRAFT_138655 [Tilletiaria anomala UBC 951]|uniref:Uncharacterized protein n=1 Tax=Tilletiaria anomala (strain ATCC 24038 / CBS 436.72 / UBC 951) TaxID=1037660 RepID=A0A066VVT4_TILAU|nr:uncharacterized protein K437DRAFT_138655 [Tilletiaria anomala UBC 951]KDN44368.1 hypothetical protein K437DRAFT_138655 [Tilletiaria anomala UBC 951]
MIIKRNSLSSRPSMILPAGYILTYLLHRHHRLRPRHLRNSIDAGWRELPLSTPDPPLPGRTGTFRPARSCCNLTEHQALQQTVPITSILYLVALKA